MKYLGKVMSIGAVILLLAGCTEKPLAPAAQINTPDEQTVVVDGEKQRIPLAAGVI